MKLTQSHMKFNKIQPTNQGFGDPDLISAPSLNPAPKAAKKDLLILPLEAWAFGNQVYQEKDTTIRHFLHCEDRKLVIFRQSSRGKSRRIIDEFALDSDISKLCVRAMVCYWLPVILTEFVRLPTVTHFWIAL